MQYLQYSPGLELWKEGWDKPKPAGAPLQELSKGASEARSCCRFFNLAFSRPQGDKSLSHAQARHRLSNPSIGPVYGHFSSLAQPDPGHDPHPKALLGGTSSPSLAHLAHCRLLDDSASRSDCHILAQLCEPTRRERKRAPGPNQRKL